MKKGIGVITISVFVMAIMVLGVSAGQNEDISSKIKEKVEKIKQDDKNLELKDKKVEVSKEQKVNLDELKKSKKDK